MSDEAEMVTLEQARASGLLPKLRPKPKPKRKPRTDPWDSFVSEVGALCLALHLDLPTREYRFHQVRLWRFDLSFPRYHVAIEREGGTWTRGRHVRGKGYANDCLKYSEAAVLGWIVLRLTSDMLTRKERGASLDLVRRALAAGESRSH